MIINTENLNDKLDLLTKELKGLKALLDERLPKETIDLTKRKNVLKYLNITESTLTRYIKTGVLKQDYHYLREVKNNKHIIIFVSGAIEEFKKRKTK